MKNSAHDDFNDKNLDKVRIKVNTYYAVGGLLTRKIYGEENIDEPTLVRESKQNDFNNHSPSNVSHTSLKFVATVHNDAATKGNDISLL